MMRREYRLEVLTGTLPSGEEIWNPIGYEMVFDNIENIKNWKIEKQNEYPNNRYRITEREIGEWEVVE